jgi:hypothetical protein
MTEYAPSKDEVFEELKIYARDANERWIMVGYDKSNITKGYSNTLTVSYRGTGGIDETVPYLREGDVAFIVLKLYDNPQDTNSPVNYIIVNWLGTKVKPLQKAKCNTHMSDLTSLVESALGVKLAGHIKGVNEIDADTTLTDMAVKSKVMGVSRARRGMSRFGSQPNLKATTTLQQNFTNNATTKEPPKKTTSSLGAQLRIVLSLEEANIEPALRSLNDSSDKMIRWAILNYGDDGVLKVTAQGGTKEDKNSSVNDFKSMLDKDAMSYVILKWNMGGDLGYGTDTEKCLFVVWIGPGVSSIWRGKVNQHRPNVYTYCKVV